jgi:peptide/nickel transport system substrate-binding protein
LTGKDVAYTYRSVLDSNLGSPFHGDYRAKIESVAVDPDDPYHVIFTVKQPYATFLTDLVLGIVPAWLEDKPRGLFPAATYVGTGPFRFVEQSYKRRLILERYKDWHHEASSFRWLVFKTIPDESTRLLSLLGGSTDLLLNGISPILLDVLRDHPGIRVESAPAIAFTYIGFNLRDSRLADARVRKALAMAIDRERIIEHRFMGKATPATSMLPALHWAHNPEIPLIPADTKKAKLLLDEAGFKPNPETGIRMEIELKISTDRFRRSIAKMIAHQLEDIGVRLKIRSYEFSTFFADVRSGNFDLFMLQLPAPIEPDMHRWMFYSLNTPETGPFPGPSPYAQVNRSAFHPRLKELLEDPLCGGWARKALADGEIRQRTGEHPNLGIANRTYYANPRVDCLVDLGMLETDQEKRKPLYANVQKILAEELPIIPLWHEDNIVVLREKVRRFGLLPNASFATLPQVKLAP